MIEPHVEAKITAYREAVVRVRALNSTAKQLEDRLKGLEVELAAARAAREAANKEMLDALQPGDLP